MKQNDELLVEGKPISEWAKDQNWIQIGDWQVDPKHLSIKWINETIAWEQVNAKREVLTMVEDKIYEWKLEKKISNKQYKFILNYIASICPAELESKLPKGTV